MSFVFLLLTAQLDCRDHPCVISRVRVECGDGETLEDATVVLHKGKITRLTKDSVMAPSGAQILVAPGKVLTPGLIEPLSDLGLLEVQGVQESRDDVAHESLSPALRAADGFNAASVWIPIAREEGITAAVIAPRGALLHGTGNWLDLAAPPKLEASPIAMFGGITRHAMHGNNRSGLWMRIREVIADARFYKSNARSFEQGATRPLSATWLQLIALWPVLDDHQLLVLDADRASDIEAALELARTEKLHIAISGGAEAWRVREALAKAKVPVILQPSKQTPTSFDALFARDDSAALLSQAGVPLVLTANDDQRIGRLRQEAGQAVAFGLSHPAAVRAITLAPAELYGRGQTTGSVREGKRATVVLWSGDPLELSSVAERVLIDGVEQPLDTRQRQLVRRYLQ